MSDRAEQPHPAGREEIVTRLFALFRRHGFEGVSLSDISRATGLGKSSLYHHFPGGKEEMAQAVVARAAVWAAEALVGPLRAPGPRAERVAAMLRAVEALYDGGREPCLIASMIVGAQEGALALRLRTLTEDWLAALTAALTDTGADPAAARAASWDAVARIQGALVLSRVLGDRAPFAAALAAVGADLARV